MDDIPSSKTQKRTKPPPVVTEMPPSMEEIVWKRPDNLIKGIEDDLAKKDIGKNTLTPTVASLLVLTKGLCDYIDGLTLAMGKRDEQLINLQMRVAILERGRGSPLRMSEPLTLDSIVQKEQLKSSIRRLAYKGVHSMEIEVNGAKMIFPHVSTVVNPVTQAGCYAAVFDKQMARRYLESGIGSLRRDTMEGNGQCRVVVRDLNERVVREEAFNYTVESMEGQSGYRINADGVSLYVNDIGAGTFKMKMIAIDAM